MDANHFTGAFPEQTISPGLLVADISNNRLSGSVPAPYALTDYYTKFEPLDAAAGISLILYVDNNEISGTLPEQLLPHAEVRSYALMLLYQLQPADLCLH